MKRPPFDRRLPLFLVFAGIFAVLLSLGAFNVSLRKMSVENAAPSGEREAVASAPIEERNAAGLNWNLLLSLEKWHLRAELRDALGTPVTGGRARLTLQAPDTSRQVVPLRETEPGLYVGELPRIAAGSSWIARVNIDRDEGRIARAVRISY